MAIIAAIVISMTKQYTITSEKYLIIVAIILSIGSFFFYIEVFRNNNISTTYPIIKILSILLVVFAGILLFGEELSTKNIIGILLGLAAIYLLI